MTIAAVGLVYLALGFLLWVHAWSAGATTHTLCGCGDPAMYLWFFQWPATAVAHGHNPFYSTALFHPTGVNLLAQAGVTGLSVPLIPVTLLWGPVASLNVAATITPALSAFSAFVVLRRWAPWTPAAFVGGLLFGFSPFVLNGLEIASLNTAAVMLLPLVLAVLDEILIRQRHGAAAGGALLGLLLFGQFFLSTELLLITVLVILAGLVALVAGALVFDRDGLVHRAPHAAKGLVSGAVVSAVLLAGPVWFALAGPAHLSGLLWPDSQIVGGYVPSSFVAPAYPQGPSAYYPLGGYLGPHLASSGYLGWGVLAVLFAGIALFWRDARLWFFGFVLLLCAVMSLGVVPGEFRPAQLLARVPVLDNVIQQRFMAFGFLAAAVLLAMVLDKIHGLVPDWRGVVGTLAVASVALVPVIVTFAPKLPFTMEAVTLPRWYNEVAPNLPPGRVLMSYPAPSSGIQVAMAWQAVNRINYSQAGGGGPQNTAARAGTARAGYTVLGTLGLSLGRTQQPTGTRAELAAVRQALAVWRVTTVVIATDPGAPLLEQGHDPTYAAAFMTAALGRRPDIEAGAWVWNGVLQQRHDSLEVPVGTLQRCTHEAAGRAGRSRAPSERVTSCVVRAASATP